MTRKQSLLLGCACLSSTFFWFFLILWMGQTHQIAWTVAITLLTAILWISEAIPIPAASIVPFALFPFSGVLSHKEVASALGSHVILLLMGGFMLSKSLENSGVHKRLAVYMVQLAGGHSGRNVVIGFMLASAFLSMWVSNTATVLMLIPIALAVLQHNDDKSMDTALIMGIAYAASLGGIGTPIGTPPNMIFISVYQETTKTEIDFIAWMQITIPIIAIGIPIMAFWLTRHLSNQQTFSLPKVNPWCSAEKRVLMVFGMIVLAWVTRRIWSEWFNLYSVGDSTVALLGVVLMFIIPSGKKQSTLLDWDTAKDIPWGMLLLFAGGISIAKAFTASGLSEQLSNTLSHLSTLPLWALILSLCLFVTFLTEITSNTATATLLMPILAAVGISTGVDPKLLMIPATISASCAFMLPVATAPNAIAYGTNKFQIKDMMKEGFALNLLLACIISGVCYFTLR